jgi:serine/threonine-protein kinase PknG
MIDANGVCDACGTPAIHNTIDEPLSSPTARKRRSSAATTPEPEFSSPTAQPQRTGGSDQPDAQGDAGAEKADSDTIKPRVTGSEPESSVHTRRKRPLQPDSKPPKPDSKESSSTRHQRERPHLGMGLVTVPKMPVPDADGQVLSNPEIAEDHRFCRCGAPVGRSKGQRPGPAEGFCPRCRYPYSFVPKLKRGDLVGGQYLVEGCLAHGGLGWIYLARDQELPRWVVLKGLRDAADPDSIAAAAQERRVLATLKDPNIVEIHNSLQHRGDEYLLMEYVGGVSLDDLLKQRRAANGGEADPLPVKEAIAYILELLPTFGYLHRVGLLYCDFKPANVMLQGDRLKLIDLGGAKRIDDDSPLDWGTRGFRALEVQDSGPSVASDLYTVGRTLAVLTLDFHYRSMEYQLPAPASHPVLRRYNSYYRFLLKATEKEPRQRFQSADDMADQLLGVLRQIVAIDGETPPPAASVLFASGGHPTGETNDGRPLEPSLRLLPALRVDLDDPAAPTLATLPTTNPAGIIERLEPMTPRTREIELQLARAHLESRHWDQAEALLAETERVDPMEWRVDWYRGLLALEKRDFGAARYAFDSVVDEIPGELIPRLALAITAEGMGDIDTAVTLYNIVSGTDPTITSAAFGLARCCKAVGQRAKAVAAYRRVPEASSAYTQAQMRAAGALLEWADDSAPSAAELADAGAAIEALNLDAEQQVRLTRDLLESALGLLTDGRLASDESVTLAGVVLEEEPVRRGLEDAYRALARVAENEPERLKLVDRANDVRPRTMV